jgi:hypothetical protein
MHAAPTMPYVPMHKRAGASGTRRFVFVSLTSTALRLAYVCLASHASCSGRSTHTVFKIGLIVIHRSACVIGIVHCRCFVSYLFASKIRPLFLPSPSRPFILSSILSYFSVSSEPRCNSHTPFTGIVLFVHSHTRSAITVCVAQLGDNITERK